MSLEHDATTLDVEVHRVTRAGPSAARPSAGMTSRPEEVGISPLKVSADRIGATAMRCAFLLAALEAEGVEIDRSGRTGAVVEVNPAAALTRWRLPFAGYKASKMPQIRCP